VRELRGNIHFPREIPSLFLKFPANLSIPVYQFLHTAASLIKNSETLRKIS
jgi:hypothetical protein